MNCEEAIRLIHLDADGETSAREGEALRAHLLSCEGCANEARLVRQTERTMHRLRTSMPVLTQPEDLVKSILAGISGNTPRRSRSGSIMEAFFNLSARPGFRLAYAAVVLAFVSLFMLQQADTFRSVEALGEKLAQAQRPTTPDVQYSITIEDARDIIGSSELEPFIEGTPVSVSSERISVRKSDLASLAPSLGSRLASRLLASSDTPVERLPHLIVDIQQSLTSSLTLRPGGKDR